MPDTTFDPRVEVNGVNLFKGEFTKIALRQEPGLPHHMSNRVIDPDEELLIDLEWRVSGPEVPLRMNAVGDWRIYAYAESVGPGPEIELGPQGHVSKGAVSADLMSWSTTLKVDAKKLSEHLPASGVYKICVVAFANSNLPGPGDDVIGFGTVPVILSERPE